MNNPLATTQPIVDKIAAELTIDRKIEQITMTQARAVLKALRLHTKPLPWMVDAEQLIVDLLRYSYRLELELQEVLDENVKLGTAASRENVRRANVDDKEVQCPPLK